MARSQPRRLALVVGNSTYETAASLKNAANDAVALGKKLSELGFEVMGGSGADEENNVGIDLDRSTSIRRFGQLLEKIAPGDTVFIFYAGHGLQIANENYLVPVDASLAGDEPLSQLVRMRAMIEQAAHKAGRGGTTIVFLDACRENPFSPEQVANLSQHASRSLNAGQGQPMALSLVSRGFATMKMQTREDASGTFISFATAPGDVAYDGSGENSPFTLAVLEHVDTRGLALDDFIDRVVLDVLDRSEKAGRYQDPWYESNLRRDFYFRPTDASPVFTLGLLGLAAGAILTYALLELGAFSEAIQGKPTNPSLLIYLSGLLFAAPIAYGVLRWGSGKVWHSALVLVITTAAFALALFILQTPIVQPSGDASLFGNEPLSWESIKNRVRLQKFLANPKFVSMSVLVLLAGLALTSLTAAALKVQGGGFRGFGTLVGSMIVGVTLPFMVVAMLWCAELSGQWAQDNIVWLGVVTGSLWFMILGAQIGYCFMYHVPEHRRITGRRR